MKLNLRRSGYRKLETEREAYVPQLVEQSRTIGYLESKNESLEEEKKRLLSAPVHNTTRIIEQQSIDDSDHEDVPEGESHEGVTN